MSLILEETTSFQFPRQPQPSGSSWFQTINLVISFFVVVLLVALITMGAVFWTQQQSRPETQLSANEDQLSDHKSFAVASASGFIDKAALRYCKREMEDFAVTPEDPFYAAYAFVSLPQFNLPHLQPPYVVVPTKVSQLQAALQCATKEHLYVSIKGGGHSYAGFSQSPIGGFPISLRRLNTVEFIQYDGGPALKVGGGTIFQEVYDKLNSSHREWLLAGGLCPSVGVTAFHLGGGLGSYSRQFGIGSDNVLEIEMVTSDGQEIVLANKDVNSDLFWALRGGGGPSFGVVTSMIIRLHPAQKKYSYGEFCAGTTSPDIRANLKALAKFTNHSDFPDWLTVHWRFVKRKNPNATGLCYLVYSLRNATETEAALAPIRPQSKEFSFSQRRPPPEKFWNFIHEFDDFYSMGLDNAQYKGYERFATFPEIYATSMLPPLNDGIIELLTRFYLTLMPDQQKNEANCYIQGMVMGGRISRFENKKPIPVNYSAFPWRDRIIYAADAMCSYADRDQQKDSEKFISLYAEQSKTWSRGIYLNFPQPNVEDYSHEYWRENVPKLLTVKKKWNPKPDNPLHFSQEVN